MSSMDDVRRLIRASPTRRDELWAGPGWCDHIHCENFVRRDEHRQFGRATGRRDHELTASED